MKKVTAEQIKGWKEKHGEVHHLAIPVRFEFQIDTEGNPVEVAVEWKECYLHQPSRQTLALAMAVGKANPIKFNETLLNNCWIDGDEEIKTNDNLFMSASAQLEKLMDYKTATLKKL